MSDVTQILLAIDQGNPTAAEALLPLVYDKLRILAAQKMAQEKPGETLQATALNSPSLRGGSRGTSGEGIGAGSRCWKLVDGPVETAKRSPSF